MRKAHQKSDRTDVSDTDTPATLYECPVCEAPVPLKDAGWHCAVHRWGGEVTQDLEDLVYGLEFVADQVCRVHGDALPNREAPKDHPLGNISNVWLYHERDWKIASRSGQILERFETKKAATSWWEKVCRDRGLEVKPLKLSKPTPHAKSKTRNLMKRKGSIARSNEKFGWSEGKGLCPVCNGDGGAAGQCYKCGGSGWA